jgi:hypothetical protein
MELKIEDLDLIGDEKAESDIEAKRSSLERRIFLICIALVLSGVAYATVTPHILQTIISWFSPSGGHVPAIISMAALDGNDLSKASSHTYSTFNNTFVRINVSFNDTDPNDWHTLIVCNGTAGNYTYVTNNVGYNFTCTGHGELCVYSVNYVTDNPLHCDVNVTGYANQTQNFTAYVLDSGGRLVFSNGTFEVDRPPVIHSILAVKK